MRLGFGGLGIAFLIFGCGASQAALAGLLLVDGDPIADIQLVADPERNFVMIMKDGKLFKDALP